MVHNPFSNNNTTSSSTGAPAPEPNEPPPAYAQATGQQPATTTAGHGGHRHTESLEIPGNARRASSDYTASEGDHDEIIPEGEREQADALTDERPIPKGWTREYDANSGHVFFVDTQANPPRSIWTHPLDPTYVSSLPLDQQPQWMAAKTKKDGEPVPTGSAGPYGEHNPHPKHTSAYAEPAASTSRQQHQPQHQQQQQHQQAQQVQAHGEDKRTFGRKFKDALHGNTHEDRVRDRAAQAKAERERYDEYIKRRKALQAAYASGQYQPRFAAPQGAYTYGGLGGGYGSRYGGGYDVYGNGYSGYGYPNRRYAPGGMYGYGNSRAGMGTGMALGGGLLGGLLIGDMMF